MNVAASPVRVITTPEPDAQNDPVAVRCEIVTVSFKRPIPAHARCHYCASPASTRDHVVPRKRDGLDRWWNLVPACTACNRGKGFAATYCSCAFCQRAIHLFSLGYRRR